MPYRNTEETYGSISKWFHWLTFLAVIGLLTVGAIMVGLPSKDPNTHALYNAHKLTGLAVLTLMTLRLIWALSNIKPTLPPQVPTWQRFAARTVQYSLYGVLLLMPLSGWALTTSAGYIPHLFDWSFPMPGITKNDGIKHFTAQAHYILAWTIVALLVLHVSAALKHHFIDQDNVLRTMLPRLGKR